MTSKRDLLAHSDAFAAAQRPVSARRQAVDAALAKTKVNPKEIAFNPANPREELKRIPELAASLRRRGQITAITVMTRKAFEDANPEGAKQVPSEMTYVALDGNRRLAATLEAGLDSIDIKIGDDLADTADQILELALIASIHNEPLAPMDMARAIEALVQLRGPRSQSKVAVELGLSEATVSDYLAMLKNLEPEVREAVDDGEVTVREARKVSRVARGKSAEEQLAEVQRIRQQEAAKKAKPTVHPSVPAQAQSPGADQANLHPVKNEDAGQGASQELQPQEAPAPSGEANLHPVKNSAAASTDLTPLSSTLHQCLHDYGAEAMGQVIAEAFDVTAAKVIIQAMFAHGSDELIADVSSLLSGLASR